MRKFISLMMVLFAATSVMMAAEGGTLTPSKTPFEPTETVTLTYDGTGTNFANWEPLCFVHAWLVAAEGKTLSKDYGTAWASCNGDADYAKLDSKVKMTLVTKGKYTIDINIKEFFGVAEADLEKIGKMGVIVRAQYEGENNKTNDFFINVSSEQEPPTPVDSMTVYFVNTKDWTKVQAYLYTNADPWPQYKTWPGEAMTKTGDKALEKDVYKYTFPASYNTIIFNNKTGDEGVQLSDATWSKEKPYYMDGEWFASLDDIKPVVPAKFYVTGDSALIVDAGLDKSKAWNSDAFKSEKDTCVLNLKKDQNYKLKVVAGGKWLGYDKLSKKVDGLNADADGNINFKLNEAGEVKVVFIAAEKDTTFELLGNFFVKPAVHKDGYYLMGSHNEWAIGDEYMFATTDVEGEYKLEVTLALDQEIKPARVAHDNAVEWFGANNYKVPAEYVGAKVIYFRPAGNEDAAWQAFGGFFYIVPNDPTGMESIQPSAISSQKVIENGMLIIEKAGVKYNAMGQKIQ